MIKAETKRLLNEEDEIDVFDFSGYPPWPIQTYGYGAAIECSGMGLENQKLNIASSLIVLGEVQVVQTILGQIN